MRFVRPGPPPVPLGPGAMALEPRARVLLSSCSESGYRLVISWGSREILALLLGSTSALFGSQLSAISSDCRSSPVIQSVTSIFASRRLVLPTPSPNITMSITANKVKRSRKVPNKFKESLVQPKSTTIPEKTFTQSKLSVGSSHAFYTLLVPGSRREPKLY